MKSNVFRGRPCLGEIRMKNLGFSNIDFDNPESYTTFKVFMLTDHRPRWPLYCFHAQQSYRGHFGPISQRINPVRGDVYSLYERLRHMGIPWEEIGRLKY